MEISSNSTELAVKTFYEQLILEQMKLSQGYELIRKQFEQNKEFVVHSCTLLLDGSLDKTYKTNVSIFLKIIIEDWWMDHQMKEQQKSIRELLLNALIANVGSLKLIETIGLTLVAIFSQEEFDLWLPPLLQLTQWMITEDIQIIESSIEFFLSLFTMKEKMLYIDLANTLNCALFKVFTVDQLDIGMRCKVLKLLGLVIQAFSYADGDESEIVQKCFEESFELWLSVLISTLQTQLVNEPEKLLLKYRTTKILLQIFRDLPDYSRLHIQSVLQQLWKI